MRKLFSYVIVILCLSILSGFIARSLTLKPKLLPNANLPPLEIVFAPLIQQGEHGTKIGFMDADGNNVTSRSVAIPVEIITGLPFKQLSSFISPLHNWSMDGYYLGLIMGAKNRGLGFPILISPSGEAISCPQGSIPHTADRFWVKDLDHVIILAAQSSDTNNRIVQYNMGQCREVKELFQSADYIWDVAVSNKNWIAVSVRTSVTELTGNTYLYSDTGELIFAMPWITLISWSKDGEWIAYAVYDHSALSTYLPLRVMRKDGTEDRAVTQISGSPSWSPDGKWIVFERDHIIYKVNTITGDETEMTKGTLPNWRWDIPND